jgi:hypothetical protein
MTQLLSSSREYQDLRNWVKEPPPPLQNYTLCSQDNPIDKLFDEYNIKKDGACAQPRK